MDYRYKLLIDGGNVSLCYDGLCDLLAGVADDPFTCRAFWSGAPVRHADGRTITLVIGG